MAAEYSTLYDIVGIPETYQPAGATVLSGLALTAVGFYVRSRIRKKGDDVLPDPKCSVVNVAVSIVSGFRTLLHGMMGKVGEYYLPLIVATFLFILFNNYSGMIPGLIAPTENINTNLAMALFVFVAYQYLGFREHGAGYLKQFTGGMPPKGYGVGLTIVMSVLAILVIAIELIGHVVRPFSLSLRLWGTMTGDHALVGVILELVPFLVPSLAILLGLFVGLVQALVFSLLSSVYIKLAISHDH